LRTLHGSCFEEALTVRGAKEKVRMVALGFSEVLASLVADTTVVVSPSTRRWVPWVHRVVPNGVDTQRFHPSRASRADRPTVLFVGTWHGRKRGSALAAAFCAEVLPAVPDAELLLVTQDAPTNVGPGVRVMGRLSDEALADAYRRAWVFCLPSAYEGFGIPYAEALASGTPVVATPNVGALYVLDNGAAGVIVGLPDVGRTLIELLGNEARRDRMRAAGLARAREFALTSVVDQYEAIYRGGPEPRRRQA
jgi:glycosyltransferase involved in cell wall biosynthesis